MNFIDQSLNGIRIYKYPNYYEALQQAGHRFPQKKPALNKIRENEALLNFIPGRILRSNLMSKLRNAGYDRRKIGKMIDKAIMDGVICEFETLLESPDYPVTLYITTTSLVDNDDDD